MNEFMDPNATAGLLGVSAATLARWRVLGSGPRFHKIGGRVAYTRTDVTAWVDSRARFSTARDAATAGAT